MFDTILAIGTIALQIFFVVVLVGWIAGAPFIAWLSHRTSFILRAIFLGAVIGSFVYQYVFSFEPCVLCWYQRIAIFSITILLFTANIRTNALLRLQTLVLGSAGLAVALFHKYLELFPNSSLVCDTNGPSCTTLYVFQFGYITIPMMSITVLATGILLSLIAGRFPQESVAR